MNARLWFAAVVASIVLLPFRIEAHDQREKAPNGLRKEVLELKRLILDVAARLEEMERRLSQLEKRLDQRAEPTTKSPADRTKKMRPLGNHLMVDEKGIIWSHGRPVGHWGVDGDIPRGPNANVPKDSPATPPRGAPK